MEMARSCAAQRFTSSGPTGDDGTGHSQRMVALLVDGLRYGRARA